SGPLTGGDNNGTYVVFNSGNGVPINPPGQVAFWNPVTGNWLPDTVGFGGTSGYNGLLEYSRTCNCGVFGGGPDPRKVWRLNSDRTVTAMPDAPLDYGIQQANLVPDPVTGNFLFLGHGSFYEFNPTGNGSWKS